MNPLLEWLEALVWGEPDEELDLPLLRFRELSPLTLRDAFQNVAFIGSQGSGKTTSAKTYYQAMLLEQFGGLVLCVKESQADEIIAVCKGCGRAEDLIILGRDKAHRFNPLEGATIKAASSLLVELGDVLRGCSRRSTPEDAFWRGQCEIMVAHLLTLCREFYGRLDITDVAKMFAGRPHERTQLADPSWRSRSVMASALDAARAKSDDVLHDAVQYFEYDFPTHGDRLQGSLAATVNLVLEHLRHEPLRTLFSGRSTFTMDDIFIGGKICVVAIPTQGSEVNDISPSEGKIANGLMQFCFCRAATLRKRESNVFLIEDECQETVSGELQRQLSVMREYRVATVLLTQDLAALDPVVGAEVREGILSKCKTKIFLEEVHSDTREWASKQIGKWEQEELTRNRNWGRGGSGGGLTRKYEEKWQVRPEDFANLKDGGKRNKFIVETIVLKGGNSAREKWHQKRPGKKGTVRIA